MNKILDWKNPSTSVLLVALGIVAVPAGAQLEVGGQPFQGSQSEPASETGSDELTQRIQRDLVALGYEPGSISGEMTVDTAVAISKFQSENEMDVTGSVSPQLAGILAARVSAMRGGDPAQEKATVSAASDNCTPTAAEPAAESSDSAGRLARAGGRLFNRFGSRRANQQLAEVAGTASDIVEVADVVSDLTECEP